MNVTYPSGWTFTAHALRRMDEMGLFAGHVHDVLEESMLRYPGHDGPDGQKREVRVGGQLAVVVSCEDRSVVTVLWHCGERRTYLPPAA